MQNHCFFWRQRNNFDSYIIMENNICNTTFLTYKIPNPLRMESYFSGPNDTKYLLPS